MTQLAKLKNRLFSSGKKNDRKDFFNGKGLHTNVTRNFEKIGSRGWNSHLKMYIYFAMTTFFEQKISSCKIKRIIFILQSILNTVVSRSGKSCYLRLKPTRDYSRLRRTRAFRESYTKPHESSSVVNNCWYL